jgi:ribosomal protein L11 methyltransferase
VRADHEAVEQVSEILSRVCTGGVSVEAPFNVTHEGLAATVDTAQPAIVRGYVSAEDAGVVDAAIESVERDLSHLQAFGLRDIAELETRLVHEEDWAEAWKEHFPVMRVGRRFVIQPTWRDYEPTPNDLLIRLDPGRAFGTGLHPTTRLCLMGIEDWYENHLTGDARVLDVGCGSGILAIAAARTGGSVIAIDIDPVAVESTIANSALNGFEALITARQGSLPLEEPRLFHLVLANLISGVLIDLADDLAASIWPGGRLLAGGVFHERESEVRQAFESAGLRIVGRREDGDWRSLEATRD